MDLPQVEIGRIQVTDPPRIIWVRVQDAIGLLWGDNPKEHDVGLIISSIDKYGFQELPKYDATLGGIKAGNGRTYCLGEMEKKHYAVPRGIGIIEDKNGKSWVMPLMIGTDAESADLAIAYAIDSNNLTMAGGDFDGLDFSRLWDPTKYLDILDGLNEQDYPITVSPSDMLDLGKYYSGGASSGLLSQKDNQDSGSLTTIQLKVRAETKKRFKRYYETLTGDTDDERINKLLDAI